MNIRPIFNNINQNNARSNNKVCFTSVVPFKVYVDGNFVSGRSPEKIVVIKKVLRAFSKILANRDTSDVRVASIKEVFASKDKNFAYYDRHHNWNRVRNEIMPGISYLFTGTHSKQLEENLGKPIGRAKRKANETFEVVNVRKKNPEVKKLFKNKLEKLIRDFNSNKRKIAEGSLASGRLNTNLAIPRAFNKVVNELCGKVGEEKKVAIEHLLTDCMQGIDGAVENYFKVKRDFLESSHGRIRNAVDNDRNYVGPEIGLRINASTVGIRGKKNYKINIDNIEFEERKHPSFPSLQAQPKQIASQVELKLS